jgi:hypothetical protein
MTYREKLKRMQDKILRDFVMLKHDPHFVSMLEILEAQRLEMWRAASNAGVSRDDQNKFLGGANTLDILVETIKQYTGDDSPDVGQEDG